MRPIVQPTKRCSRTRSWTNASPSLRSPTRPSALSLTFAPKWLPCFRTHPIVANSRSASPTCAITRSTYRNYSSNSASSKKTSTKSSEPT